MTTMLIQPGDQRCHVGRGNARRLKLLPAGTAITLDCATSGSHVTKAPGSEGLFRDANVSSQLLD
jgi:hypothetical protein